MKIEIKTAKQLTYDQSENRYVIFFPETDMDLFYLGKITSEFGKFEIGFKLNEQLQPNDVSIVESIAVLEKEFIQYLIK